MYKSIKKFSIFKYNKRKNINIYSCIILMQLSVPVATVINNPITENYVEGANGKLFLHTRIKTF